MLSDYGEVFFFLLILTCENMIGRLGCWMVR